MIAKQKNHPTMGANDFSVPFVHQLLLPVQSIKLDMPVLEVLALFQENPNLPAFPVVDYDGNYFGLASRRNYLNLMSRAYSRELFARKELVSLLKITPDIFVAPMIARYEERIDLVILEFLSRDPEIMFEALPVLVGSEILGIVKIADMMLKLSESQGSLIEMMEKMSERLKQEVASAATLQRNLLRPENIELPGVRGLSTLLTSSEVGGDFYDYYCVEDRWVVMLIGDVSGHGVAAGTMVSAAKAGVNLLESDKEKEPHKILTRLSDMLLKTARQSLLMTMFAVCLDTRTGELKYANAGHQFAYVYRAITGCLDILELGGLPLGREEGIVYEQGVTELDVGDRLFLYTDGIVEEENAAGECFGYDRLEELLDLHAESSIETLRDNLLDHLKSHVGHANFTDDVTIFYIEHYERHHKKAHQTNTKTDDFELVQIIDAMYRSNPGNAISSHIVRQNLVFLAEKNFSDLIPRLANQGVRRVLLRNQPIHNQLGWNNLLRQHQKVCHDDLAMYLNRPSQHREFHFTHSEDKAFIIEEVDAWLQETTFPNPDRLDAVILLLDELIENGLYAAPRDGKGKALYKKGSNRALHGSEILRLTLSYQDGLLGISLIDSWGTLTPAVFLNRLSRNVQGIGLDSGVGGGGLYLIWRLSDYLQVRVLPHRQTQVCAFLDLNNFFDAEIENGFQFLYHTEVHETVNSSL